MIIRTLPPCQEKYLRVYHGNLFVTVNPGSQKKGCRVIYHCAGGISVTSGCTSSAATDVAAAAVDGAMI